MTPITPFGYPTSRHVRSHAPVGYPSYIQFKKWLRDEFSFRCVYCLEREMWNDQRHRVFSVDHVVAQIADRSLITSYVNLVYACSRCNARKQAVALLDPTVEAFGKHFVIEKSGHIKGLTREGLITIEQLRLDDEEFVQNRKACFDLIELKKELPTNERVHRLFVHSFGFPSFLPDLRGCRPPGGNILLQNAANCYFARRESKTLPDVY